MKSLIVALVLSFSFSSIAKADFGLGVILGNPTGLSAKLGTRKGHAFDAALAWDLGDDHHFYLHADHLWLRDRGLVLDNVALDWFFGIGGRLVIIDHDGHKHPHHKDDDDYKLGVRAPVGIGYTFKDPRIEVFGELALILNILESTDVDLDGGIGARYHF